MSRDEINIIALTLRRTRPERRPEDFISDLTLAGRTTPLDQWSCDVIALATLLAGMVYPRFDAEDFYRRAGLK